MNSRPQIYTNVSLEDEYKARLAEIGDLHRVQTADHEEFLRSVAPADALLGWFQVDQRLFDVAPGLKVVASPSVGYDSMDVAGATERGIAICNTPGILNDAVADLTMCLVLMLARRIDECFQYARNGAWARHENMPELGNDVSGKTIGIVGFGRIGREVARRMQFLEMRTIWYDVFDQPPPDAPAAEYRKLDDLMRESDFVTIHMNLNESSHHLIGKHEIGLMRETAFLVNTARGPVVDQAALTEALRNGEIAGAGLDVLEQEPPAEGEPIIQLPNVITLPHIGTATHETRKAMRGMSVDNLIAVLRDEQPLAIVNPEVLTRK